MDLKDLLRSIRPGSNYTDIKQIIADLKDTSSDSDDKPGVEEEMSDALQEKWDILETSIDQLSDYIFKIQQSQDRQILPNLKSSIGDSIVNYTTAYNATETYDKDYFSNLYLSIEGKIDLALFLIDVIKKYCQSNLETLRLISNRDPNLILYISYPRSS